MKKLILAVALALSAIGAGVAVSAINSPVIEACGTNNGC